MINCENCGHSSRVMQTVKVKFRTTGINGRRVVRCRTNVRRRKCNHCGYIWKTIEVPIRRSSKTWNNVVKEKESKRVRLPRGIKR